MTAPTVAQLVDQYVLGRVACGAWKPSSASTERQTLLKFAAQVSDTPADEITRADVQAWVNGAPTDSRRARLDRRSMLRRFFDALVNTGALVRNPVIGIDVGTIVDPPHRKRPGPPRRPDSPAIERFLVDLHRRGLRPRSIRQYRHVLARFERLHGGDVLTATSADLVAYVDRYAGHSTEYRCRIVTVLTLFYRHATREGLIDPDPSRVLVRPRRAQHLPRPTPDDDLVRILAAASEAPFAQWMRLAPFCGLRACEVALVRREDIRETPDGALLVIPEGKGGKARVVPLPDEVLDALRDPALPRTGWLWPRPSEPERPILAESVSTRANRWLRELGVAHTFHSLRHFYGTTMYGQTLDLRLVQELMGHADPRTTAGYAALNGGLHAPVVRSMPARWLDGIDRSGRAGNDDHVHNR